MTDKAADHQTGSGSAGHRDKAQQPLLFDTDQEAGTASEPSSHTTKDGRDSWNWLEKLVFKTRVHFAVSVALLFVLWTLIALAFSGDLRASTLRLPWLKRPGDPGYYTMDFYAAKNKLADQPFCLPDLGLLRPADVKTNQSDWDESAMLRHAGTSFDALAGTQVREAAQRRRHTVETIVSIAQGDPIYTRTATMCAASSTDPKTASNKHHVTFRSPKLWYAIEQLASLASLFSRKEISPEEMLQALQLNETRAVQVSRNITATRGNYTATVTALETTILDVQRFVQTLINRPYYLDFLDYVDFDESPYPFLDGQVVYHFLTLQGLNTDGITSYTNSPFIVMKKEVARNSPALFGVGHHGRNRWAATTQRQKATRPLELYTFHETTYDGRELDIAFNLESGLIVTTLAHLGSDNGSPSHNGTSCSPRIGSDNKSPWDWLLTHFDGFFNHITWRLELQQRDAWSGTYRYQTNSTSGLDRPSSSNEIDWIEVDVEQHDRALWITRIEYMPAAKRPSTSTQVTFSTVQGDSGNVTGPVSILKKYNVGGTADFLAGWTCQWSDQELADCYRPRMGNDDSKCTCKDWGSDTTSSYRVGLWPVRGAEFHNHDMYDIPRGAICLDGNSYMDQALGGCAALHSRDELLIDEGPEQSVPEMEAIGYTVEFSTVEHQQDGVPMKEAQLELVYDRIKLKRVSRPNRWSPRAKQ